MLAILRYSAVIMLLGRAYHMIRWQGPFRDIFYDPQGVGGWYATLVNRPLQEIYNDHFYEFALSYFSDFVGYVFIVSSFVILFYERLFKLKWVIYLAIFFLGLVFFGMFYGKHMDQFGMFFEHSAQLVFPLFFIFQFENKIQKLEIWGTIAISLTFLCHGLYAYGYYPQPGGFADMMIIGFDINEDNARFALKILGIADFIFAGLVLAGCFWHLKSEIPKWLKISFIINLWYGVIWGFATAFARVYTTYTEGMLVHWMDQYFFEFMVRVPHFIVPFILIRYMKRN